MKLIHLDTPMKLMSKDNVSFNLETPFIYEVPKYMYEVEGLQVICSLKNNTTMAYNLLEGFKKLLDMGITQEDIEKHLEAVLWGLSTYKEVVLQDSIQPAILIKEKLFIK